MCRLKSCTLSTSGLGRSEALVLLWQFNWLLNASLEQNLLYDKIDHVVVLLNKQSTWFFETGWPFRSKNCFVDIEGLDFCEALGGLTLHSSVPLYESLTRLWCSTAIKRSSCLVVFRKPHLRLPDSIPHCYQLTMGEGRIYLRWVSNLSQDEHKATDNHTNSQLELLLFDRNQRIWTQRQCTKSKLGKKFNP